MTDANQIFSDLNQQQLQAVNCSLGNKLILAGAGSGKTRVLTCRVAKLINTFDVRPSNILALTFTNKASNEMKQRLERSRENVCLVDQSLSLLQASSMAVPKRSK